MPTKRAAPCAVAVGNKLIVVGGISETQEAVDAVEVYDIDTKEWAVKDSLKDKLLGLSGVARGWMLFLVLRNLALE